MKNEHISIPVPGGEEVSGILSIPDAGRADTAIIVAHGAGNDMNHPMLAFFADGLAGAGYLCLRFNFLYREKGRKGPDTPGSLYSAWQAAYHAVADHPDYRPKKIAAAGKSLGGRIASQMAAENMLPVERLIFLGYPLHAPGKTDRLRDRHLFKIPVPMLFFAGTRDALCDLQLLKQVLARITVPWDLEVIEGGDHSFNAPKSYGREPAKIHEQILVKTIQWLESLEDSHEA